MIIKIDIREKDIIHELCTTLDLKYRFLTMENNSLMVQCEIYNISPETSFHFGRMTQLRIEQEHSKERLKKFPYNII